MCRILGVWAREPFSIRKWLLDAEPGFLGLSLRGKRAPHRDGLGYAFFAPDGRWRLFRFGPKALTNAGIPGPVESHAFLLLAHARKSSPEYKKFRGAAHAQPYFHDGLFLCHNGTVRDVERLGDGFGTDSRRILLWLQRTWQPRTADRLAGCLANLLHLLQDWSALNLVISNGAELYALCAYTYDPDYFTLWVHKSAGEAAVASEPVDVSRPWEPLQNRELLYLSPTGTCERLRL